MKFHFPRVFLLASRVNAFVFPENSQFRMQSLLSPQSSNLNMSIDLLTATAADLQAKLSDGSITSKGLIQLYLNQIAKYDGYFKAVLATAPEDLLYKRASMLDDERANGSVRGPLHGIPILVKVREIVYH